MKVGCIRSLLLKASFYSGLNAPRLTKFSFRNTITPDSELYFLSTDEEEFCSRNLHQAGFDKNVMNKKLRSL
jgi:hypothetical protein